MKYDVLVSTKGSNTILPIVECGGIVLQDGDKLLVHPGIYPTLKNHYGKNLVHIGQEEKDSLRNGHYEYVSGGSKAVAQAAKLAGMPEPAVASVSSDKSITAKSKKVRHK